ncbi:MAG: peptidylprolyl isomerase [Algibacter sp.]
MRLLSILCLLFILFSCDNKPSKKNKSPETTETKANKNKKYSDSIIANKRAFPKLDSKNVMDFFLDYDKKYKENKVRMTTDFGTIDILLFEDTKFHRSNFIFLTKQKYFNNTQFYRVIDNFMIQGGASDDKKTMKKRFNIGKYLLPTDTDKGHKHDRGVISMPSSDIDNPYKLASPYEFFIVQQKGGSHFLDGDFTVFGKVIKGMDVVDKIAAVDTDEADWPLKNIWIKSVEIIE